MKKSAKCLPAALALIAAACSPESTSAGDPASLIAASQAQSSKELVVFSQNVYVGADLDAVLASPPEDLQANLFAALQTFAATNWPERAARIARFIDQQRPDVISLNEVSTVTVQGLAPFFPDTHVEFLPILQAAIAARGLDYVVAGTVANIDATLNLGGPSIRLQDFDAVMTRRGITVSNVTTGNYAAHIPVTLAPGILLDLVRGYVIADIAEGGRTARFVASHLEDKSIDVQLAQSSQLISILANSPYPVVIASDLNTDPADTAPTSYLQFRGAGLQDAWFSRIDMRHSDGFTCCESAADLRNPFQDFTKRIDLVLVRPDGRGRQSSIKPVDFVLVGDQPNERTASGMWPSDHAGVVAKLEWKKIDR